MIEIGRVCIKIAGRDAGRECTVIDILDNTFVLIDGNTRRRKCNIMHLEPTQKVIKIKKNASHDDVKKEFEKLGFETWETKPKATKAQDAKKGTKKVAAAPAKDKKVKKPAKKEEGKKAAKKETKKK